MENRGASLGPYIVVARTDLARFRGLKYPEKPRDHFTMRQSPQSKHSLAFAKPCAVQRRGDLYDVPTRDSVGKETGFDVLGVDRAGTLWLRRRSAADPKDAALLFALRSGDQQFVPVPLPAGLRGSFECGTMFARSLTTNYEIAGGNFEIRQTSIIPCGWSTTSFGVIHQQTDGTPRMLLLMPEPKEFSRIPPSLPFSIGPNGDAWVWFGYALCHVALNEQVACAPVHVEGRRDAEIDFARDGTIWFSTGYQTLVHAMSVQD